MIVSTQIHHAGPLVLTYKSPVSSCVLKAGGRPSTTIQILSSGVETVRVFRSHTASNLKRVSCQSDAGVVRVVSIVTWRVGRCLLDHWRLEAAIKRVVCCASSTSRDRIRWAQHVARLLHGVLIASFTVLVPKVCSFSLRVPRRHIVVGLHSIATV